MKSKTMLGGGRSGCRITTDGKRIYRPSLQRVVEKPSYTAHTSKGNCPEYRRLQRLFAQNYMPRHSHRLTPRTNVTGPNSYAKLLEGTEWACTLILAGLLPSLPEQGLAISDLWQSCLGRQLILVHAFVTAGSYSGGAAILRIFLR